MQARDSKGRTEEEYLKQYDLDKYPKPSLTADIVVFRKSEDVDIMHEVDVLLIRRKNPPFIGCWALPGGFAEQGESLEETAARELEEETGIKGIDLESVGAFSKPGRDPRGWVVSTAYLAIVHDDEIKPVAGDDAAELCWARVVLEEYSIRVMLEDKCINDNLAFDHYEIIYEALDRYHLLQERKIIIWQK